VEGRPFGCARDQNTLSYGDNFDIVDLHVGDETIDLVYLDPPF
jgi:site-specific DNA-methyltransferase (adenine-specific)